MISSTCWPVLGVASRPLVFITISGVSFTTASLIGDCKDKNGTASFSVLPDISLAACPSLLAKFCLRMEMFCCCDLDCLLSNVLLGINDDLDCSFVLVCVIVLPI